MIFDIVSYIMGKAAGGGGSGGKLPDAYQRVEYLKTTNYQGVSLAFPITGATITIDLSFKDVPSLESGFAGWYESTNNLIELYGSSGAIKVYGKNSGTLFEDTIIENVVADHVYSVSVNVSPTMSNFRIGYYRENMYPFAGNLYLVKIVKENEYSMKLVPCYRKWDNRPGLFDVINGGFFFKDWAGQTDFIVGPDVN